MSPLSMLDLDFISCGGASLMRCRVDLLKFGDLAVGYRMSPVRSVGISRTAGAPPHFAQVGVRCLLLLLGELRWCVW